MKTYGAYISENFKGKVVAANMDAAWTIAVALWGADNLQVNFWFRGC